MSKKLESMDARMLQTALNVHWQQHLTNQELQRVSETIRMRRLRLAGNCFKSAVLGTRTFSSKKRQSKKYGTCNDTIKADTGLENIREIRVAMFYQCACLERMARVDSRPTFVTKYVLHPLIMMDKKCLFTRFEPVILYHKLQIIFRYHCLSSFFVNAATLNKGIPFNSQKNMQYRGMPKGKDYFNPGLDYCWPTFSLWSNTQLGRVLFTSNYMKWSLVMSIKLS